MFPSKSSYLRPRTLLAAAAGIATGLALWVFWPVGPRAVLPAIFHCDGVYFSPDSRSLVTTHHAGNDENEGAVVLWDTATGRERRRLFDGNTYLMHVAFSPDSRQVAGRDDGKAYVSDVESGREETVLWHAEWDHWGRTPIVFSPAGKLLVFDPSRDVMVDAETGGHAVDLKGQHGIRWTYRSTEAEAHVLFSDGKNVWIVHLATGELRAAFWRNGMKTDVRAVSADGRFLILDLAAIQQVFDPKVGEFILDGRDGHGTERAIRHVFDAHTGELRGCPLANGMSWLALSPDGRWLVGGTSVVHKDDGWRRWLPQWMKPKCYNAFDAYDLGWGWHHAYFPGVTAAKFSPDGRTLAFIAEDQSVLLYDFPIRASWALIISAALLAAGIAYLLAALRGTWRPTQV